MDEFGGLESTELTPGTLAATDCISVVTDHTTIDYDLVVAHAPLVFDTRNRLPRGTSAIVGPGGVARFPLPRGGVRAVQRRH